MISLFLHYTYIHPGQQLEGLLPWWNWEKRAGSWRKGGFAGVREEREMRESEWMRQQKAIIRLSRCESGWAEGRKRGTKGGRRQEVPQLNWLKLEESCRWDMKAMRGERMGPQLVYLFWGIGLCNFICKMLYLNALRGGHFKVQE